MKVMKGKLDFTSGIRPSVAHQHRHTTFLHFIVTFKLTFSFHSEVQGRIMNSDSARRTPRVGCSWRDEGATDSRMTV
jgi:hypothetical protein